MPDLLETLTTSPQEPFALICREVDNEKRVELLLLGESIPADSAGLASSLAKDGSDSLLILPFQQITKRGFKAIDDGSCCYTLPVLARERMSVPHMLRRVQDVDIRFTDPHFNIADDEFSTLVERVINDEIAEGSGSNFVLHRKLQSRIVDFDPKMIVPLFCRLLAAEDSAYWVYAINTGDRVFIGASPEKHVQLRDGVLTMNPISGTISHSDAAQREKLLTFLADEKEIGELSMVVDEELKTMCGLCLTGAYVSGPSLQWLKSIVHTQYTLWGVTSSDPNKILHETLPMPTVTGSPVKSACEVIARYEPAARGYYGGAVAILEPQGANIGIDSAITIRTAEISTDGTVQIGAGATIVRNSNPVREATETTNKAYSIFNIITQCRSNTAVEDNEVRDALAGRNHRLSPFWLNLSTPTKHHQALYGINALLVDVDDAFTSMLARLLRAAGATVEHASIDNLRPNPNWCDGYDLVIAGPGPGDPRDMSDARIVALQELVRSLLEGNTPFIAVCLSHQVLCRILGVSVNKLESPNQGIQRVVEINGRLERVGFYNSYAGFLDATAEVCLRVRDVRPIGKASGGVLNGLIGRNFASVQFHLESVLTINGLDILCELVTQVCQRSETSERTVS